MARPNTYPIGEWKKEDREKPLAQKVSKTESMIEQEGIRPIRLDRLAESKRAKVIDIQGGWGVKRRLSQIGIHPGDKIAMVRYGPLRGPLVIEVHGFQLALGRGVASQILVEELAE